MVRCPLVSRSSRTCNFSH
uniref:ERL1d n=1 Tax=Arundo donax TaxID=35708 RepID=A0A0A9TAK3_ARUDO